MKINALLMTAISLALAGCCRNPVSSCAVIPVPPKDSRTPVFNLPLDSADNAELLDWLRYGVNDNNRKDKVGANDDAVKQYGDRLKLLASPRHPALADLATAEYKQWFPDPLVKQVVDARDNSSLQHQGTVAANDRTYWWIFYPGSQNQLTAVMVVKLNACETMKEAQR